MSKKKIALIAHDNCKQTLLDWAVNNIEILKQHDLYATGTTGKLLKETLGIDITLYKSGPLGGDLQVGASIVNGDINCVVFFWDPLEPHPHDVDVKALLRIAVVHDIPVACNKSSAEFMIKSPLMNEELENKAISTVTYGETADKIGLPAIMEEFTAENSALIERYQAGFESLLGVLAEKVSKKLKDKHDIDIIKQALEETFKNKNTNELDDEQKQKVLAFIRQTYTTDDTNRILGEFLSGNTTHAETIAKQISKIDWQLSTQHVQTFLEEYFESLREDWNKYQAAKEEADKAETAEEEVSEA